MNEKLKKLPKYIFPMFLVLWCGYDFIRTVFAGELDKAMLNALGIFAIMFFTMLQDASEMLREIKKDIEKLKNTEKPEEKC